MPLDWLFGSKKKSEPESVPPTDPPPSSAGDDFVLLDSEQPVFPPSGGSVYPILPYGVNPQAPQGGSPQATNTTHESVVQSFLSGVPFKLAASDNTPDLDSARASQAGTDVLLSYLRENISSGNFSYDFQVEKSVLQEAGCRDLG